MALPIETSPPTYMKMAIMPSAVCGMLERAGAARHLLGVGEIRHVGEREEYGQQHKAAAKPR